MAKKQRRVRDAAKERHWRKLIERRERSGQSIRAFCRAQGVSESSYQFWRRELRKRDEEEARERSRGRASRSAARTVRSDFAAVTIAAGEHPVKSDVIEIMLPRGISVRVGRGADPATLQHVLAVLGEPAC